MGRNNKSKKVLRSEKSKIKLKKSNSSNKTKFLPKGANITNTNFKVKPIQIQEQLKSKSANEPVTKRNLNLKEVLSRLDHHNVSVRFQACEGMLELLKGFSQESVEQELHVLLQKTCKLVLDTDRKIRRKILAVISGILTKASSLKIVSFFDILMLHGMSAMTHIDINIQEDSLLLMDVYLKHIPIMMVKYRSRLLSNFLSLISKLRNESNPDRTLTINLGSKITSIKWRIQVLTRLKNFLEAIVTEKKKCAEVQDHHKTYIIENVGFYLPLYDNDPERTASVFETSSNIDDDGLTEFINVLLPLLNEIWAEVVPLKITKQATTETNVTIIEQDAAAILSSTINVFYLLWESRDNTNTTLIGQFLTKTNNKFFCHLLSQFPYKQNVNGICISKESSEFLEVNRDAKCIKENLTICYMFCMLYGNLSNDYYQQKAEQVLTYIKPCLTKPNFKSSCITPLILTLEAIFFKNFYAWNKRGLKIDELLNAILIFNRCVGIDTNSEMEIFKLLAKIVELPNLKCLPNYLEWLSELPKLLCEQQLSEDVLEILSLLSRQNEASFLKALHKLLPDILNNLPYLHISGKSVYPPHLKVVNMFSYITSFSDDDINCMKSFVNLHKDTELAVYVGNFLWEIT